MKKATIILRRFSLLILIFISMNIIFYFSLCVSNEIFLNLFKSGYWYTILRLCKDYILLFQVLVGYMVTLFTVFIQ